MAAPPKDRLEALRKVKEYGAQKPNLTPQGENSVLPDSKANPLWSYEAVDSSPQAAIRNAERLRIITRPPAYAAGLQRYFHHWSAQISNIAPQVAKHIGFGPWRKRFDSDPKQVQSAFEAHIQPLLEKILSIQLDPLEESADPIIFVQPFINLSENPPLHPDYLKDHAAFSWILAQDEIKHLAYQYVAVKTHAYLRILLNETRTAGYEAAAQHALLDVLHLQVLEANFCGYYVARSCAAYFESQPMRAFTHELAHRFRAIAFGH